MRRQWAAQWSRAERWLRRRLVWRIVVAVLEIRLYDRALTLAGQAFIALVPLLIVVATLLTGSGALALGDWLIGRFALTGASADAVHALFDRPPSVSGGLTILSVLTLLVSLVSFARSIQRTYETAWRLPARGLRRSLHGLQGAFLLLLIISALAYLDSVADNLPGGAVVTAVAQTCAAIPGWWVIGRLLLNRRVTWRLLLPGAVASAVGQTIVSFAGTHYVPHLIEQNTTRYGVIGVAIALISWLVVLALLVVATAVIGAQLGAALAQHDAKRPGPSLASESPGLGDEPSS